MTTENVIKVLRSYRFPLHDEKRLQAAIANVLADFKPEHPLDTENIIDFFHAGIGIEVKIKGSRKEIYRQCVRYCDFVGLHTLILLTNRAMGLPAKINNTDCLVINLGLAWL
jgi:hypothetical protein